MVYDGERQDEILVRLKVRYGCREGPKRADATVAGNSVLCRVLCRMGPYKRFRATLPRGLTPHCHTVGVPRGRSRHSWLSGAHSYGDADRSLRWTPGLCDFDGDLSPSADLCNIRKRLLHASCCGILSGACRFFFRCWRRLRLSMVPASEARCGTWHLRTRKHRAIGR